MNILEQIIAFKREEVAARKISLPLDILLQKESINRKCFSLKDNLLMGTGTGIIAEFKRKSPSKGIINSNADVLEITSGYTNNGAGGLSILTDNHFFGGSTEDLVVARQNNIPILRKDFIIDDYQLYEAKTMGADVVLLIAACLSIKKVKQFAAVAKSLGMEVLLEIHDEAELEHLCDETDMVGINNRNLKTFRVDIEQSIYLANKIPAQMLKISESGIGNTDMLKLLRNAGFNGFLIGEQFMKEVNPVSAFEEFVSQI
ncbi:MAG: indole-3-glycerol phosphate synthase TrpC [Ferruginibacter sp.]